MGNTNAEYQYRLIIAPLDDAEPVRRRNTDCDAGTGMITKIYDGQTRDRRDPGNFLSTGAIKPIFSPDENHQEKKFIVTIAGLRPLFTRLNPCKYIIYNQLPVELWHLATISQVKKGDGQRLPDRQT